MYGTRNEDVYPMVTNPQLMRAVNRALLSAGAAGAALASPELLAQAGTQPQAEDQELEQVVVTGSRIRRVDEATASPVFTLGRETIAETGVSTVGDLMQQIPAVSGAATNPQVNNGGGTGASAIELRGLGTQRTLVLLNGRRLGNLGFANTGADVNVIPTNLVERVDVLKEGAGAIYGSDAVGGVVNFITRTDFDGLEVNYDYGISNSGDGDLNTINLAWGAQGDRGGVVISGTFQKQEAIGSGERSYTKEAIYFYTYVFAGGSSRTPNGRIFLPASHPLQAQLNCSVSSGSISVTRVAGAPGDSLGDYRCFGGEDFFNYQPYNLILTPQERGSLFTQANYEITEEIEAYGEYLHNYTTSGFEIAPLPFDAVSDTIVIPVNNVFNPFGVAFGASDPENPNNAALWRLLGLGTRNSKTDTRTDQVTVGLRGDLPWGNWEWDVSASYAGTDQDSEIDGYLFRPQLQPAFGPNFLDTDGVVKCGTPGNVIPNCVPINPFNLESEQSIAALRTIGAGYNTNYSFTQRIAGANLNGDLFELPAGPLQAAVGFEYMDQAMSFNTDFNTESQPPLYNVCQLSNETCSGDARGDYDIRALYAELFVPLLKDVPLASALNLTVGARYSEFSEFDSSTDMTFRLEWRPVDDLLVRGSYAEVFRIPTLYDLYQAPASTAASFNDPCVGLTAAQVAANPNLALACENVPTDGSFEQPNSQVDGLLLGNEELEPENGEVITFGFVYDPSWAPGLSFNVDYWDYSLEDVITQIDVNTVAEQCAATGDPQFCDLISRFPNGAIFQIRLPTYNFGKLDTSGIDAGVRYLWRDTPAGDFRFSIDATYIDKYDSVVLPGTAPIEVAGTFDRQYGNYAEWRGTAAIGWALEPFNALISARYIDGIELLDPDGAPGIQPALDIDSMTYLDASVGITVMENTRIQLSVDNITDEEPPLMYQNNVLNSNTDVSTYDLIGTYYRVSLSHQF
jgi:outer membrane receptor protein involved in Fe transport